jgi:hypothetical protein
MFVKVRGHRIKEWQFLFKAIFWTGIARLLIVLFKLKKFSFILGKHMEESTFIHSEQNKEILFQIGLAVRRASRVVPWRCKCYEQGIAAKVMLQKRGIESTIYFGVAKDEEEKLKAHAWVRSGVTIVCGKSGMNNFKVVGTFA